MNLVKSFRCMLFSPAVLWLSASCVPQTAIEKKDVDRAEAFDRVKPVLERNCVHCHSAIRLPGMPSLDNTKTLAGLIGTGKLIVPGKPDQSRFYLVTTFSDTQTGAMPPTGHAMTGSEVAILREWIQVGAPVPAEVIDLKGVGRSPRSR